MSIQDKYFWQSLVYSLHFRLTSCIPSSLLVSFLWIDLKWWFECHSPRITSPDGRSLFFSLYFFISSLVVMSFSLLLLFLLLIHSLIREEVNFNRTWKDQDDEEGGKDQRKTTRRLCLETRVNWSNGLIKIRPVTSFIYSQTDWIENVISLVRKSVSLLEWEAVSVSKL